MTPTPHTAAPWRRLHQWVPFVLLALVCVLSVVASRYISSTAEARLHAEFLAEAEAARRQIQARVNAHFDVVRASAALISANNEINGAEFRAFVAGLQLSERYPGIDGIGFSQRVRREDLRRFTRAVALDGVTQFRVWPFGQQPEYCPVVFIEPMANWSRPPVGFDLSSDAIVQAAMERARDGGQPIASAKLNNEQPFGLGKEAKFVLLVPIYRRKAPVSTVDERQHALIGFVFSPFSAQDLLRPAVVATTPAVAFEVYDGATASPAALLSESIPAAAVATYQSAASVHLGGRDWLIVVRAGGARASLQAQADRRTLVGGVLLALMLFVVTRVQVRAWETAVRHEATLRNSAQHDSLTNLPNRSLLDDHLTRAIALARRSGHRVAVLFMDLDRFKHINDSLGHPIGDQLLQSVAGRLLAYVRSSDTVSRHGGDEFVLLLSEIEQAEDASAKAQAVISALAAPHNVADHDIHVGVSIGISIYPDDGEDAVTLIKAADTAMYQVKSRGRNNYQFFRPEMNARAVERQAIEAGLRRALARQEFVLHYQPKIALETGAMAGAEALIRWKRPNGGLTAPTEFVPIAEDCGLIVPIGRWVLREACEQARAWLDGGAPVAVAVNISAIELRDKDFLEHIRRVLKETRLEPRYLELELTESVLMQNAESTIAVLQELKDIGVSIAIDDFGTGYSSLSYLRQFPIDVLKIDQSFVHEITADLDGAPIVSAIISMGKSLRQRVTAEGVETREQLAFLQAQHCSEGQGLYFSRPMTADEFAALLG